MKKTPPIIRTQKSSHVLLSKAILQDPKLSLEAKGYYGMIEAMDGDFDFSEIDDHILKELIDYGYLSISKGE